MKTIIIIVSVMVLVAVAIVLGVVLGLKKKKIKNINWLAVGSNATNKNGNIIYSSDGINWESTDKTIFNNYGSAIAYGFKSNGVDPLWVTTGSNNILYSENGIDWKNGQGAVFSNQGFGVAYGLSSNGTSPMWVATGFDGSSGDNIIFSHNGISWNDGSGAIFSEYGRDVAYGLSSNGTSPMWVAVGDDDNGGRNNIVYSYNGISWSDGRGDIFNIEGLGVAYGLSSNGTDPMWVAVGNDGTGSNKGVLYSNDGQSWNKCIGSVVEFTGRDVAYGLNSNGTSPMWVAVGQKGIDEGDRNIIYSYNGISWEDATGAVFNNINGVAYRKAGNDTLWVAIGRDDFNANSNTFLYSRNGVNWQEGTGSKFRGVANGVAGNKFNPALGAGWPNN